MNADARRARSIFLKAVEDRRPDQWGAYLDENCGSDAALRERVEVLLEAHAMQNSLLDAPAGLVATVDRPIAEQPGETIGHYKLLEQIGEGGFGVVFMAEQQQPVRRKVALKVLKPGMDTRQVVARFEAERQALALMDHPHIAHVFDGGTTAAGRPYFVMELVRGIPITEFCDQNCLAIGQRLELFVDVCQAFPAAAPRHEPRCAQPTKARPAARRFGLFRPLRRARLRAKLPQLCTIQPESLRHHSRRL
ncbi:MAG TPA: protein kinase [Pirellulales bacterium]|nr:protein kinase [Pirellulales bacterium]